MPTPSFKLHKKGVLNLPGANYASKKLVEELLLKDAVEHHCFFRASGLHNHLSHHILAAYDLGAPPSLLQKIYDEEAQAQRPILPDEKDKDILVTPENWKQFVGNPSAYGGFFKFFSDHVQSSGILATLDQFVFAMSANTDGVNMLVRLVSGALHPFIQVGYGLEFGDDILVVTGLAQAAVHVPTSGLLFSFENPAQAKSNKSSQGVRQSSKGPSVLELLKQVYESSILKPIMPYDPNALVSMRIKSVMSDGRPQEIQRICSQYYVDEEGGDEEFKAKTEEIIWASVLLTFGTGREGRKPRLDFFLMHLVTSSLFLHSYLKALKNPTHKANLLRAFMPSIVLYMLIRGRPIIKPDLLMSYTSTPRLPLARGSQLVPDKTCLGNPLDDADYNPWPAMIDAVVHHPDSHVLKTMRTLIFAAQTYGDTPPGGAIGTFESLPLDEAVKSETHTGASRMDGTIFVRAAGMLMDYMGWVTHGQPAGDWDRSAHGWDDAWNDDD